ncbi:MAG TPA: COX15/CtaA family protein [Vicinamibacteria bacterium]|nr:COX15/CtaA family protein [Vicinamibacteria bacterium]
MTQGPGVPSDRAFADEAGGPREPFSPWRHRFSVLLVAATLFLIFAGGLVTSTGSGLAVPDWPLSYGMLMPPMVGGVFYEHGHRMVATAVGFLTLVLAVWTARAEGRAGVRRLAWGALAAVVAQGLLGGLTVIFLLPTPISVSHACLAQAFFCATVALAYGTSREWLRAGPPAEDARGLRGAAATATAVVFLQLVAGAVMRHTGAGLAVPDFPRMFGRWLPPADLLAQAPVAVHLLHRAGAVLVLFAVLRLALRASRASEPRVARVAWAALALVLLQLGLGAATVLTGKAVIPTTTHVATGAAVLGLCWLATLRARRHLRPRDESRTVGAAIGDPALS